MPVKSSGTKSICSAYVADEQWVSKLTSPCFSEGRRAWSEEVGGCLYLNSHSNTLTLSRTHNHPPTHKRTHSDSLSHTHPHPDTDVPDVINDEAGGRNEEILHSIKASANRLGVDGMVGHTPAGLIDHLAPNQERGRGGERRRRGGRYLT